MNDIIITPLGTISPYCKKDMNCPGFLIEIDNQKILLDCGNGTTSLLKFPQDLKNLHVLITHYHLDHLGDLGTLQYASYVYHNLGLLNQKIKIYLPKEDYRYIKKAITNNAESYSEQIDINTTKSYNFDNTTISFYNNNSHTIESYLIKLENSNFKIVYTSDIGNTNFEELIDFCKNVDLLICESSFIKEHNSNSKTHLTAYEAGKLAKLANVKQLLLTHFWPETDKILYYLEAKEQFENVEVAQEGKKLVLRRK